MELACSAQPLSVDIKCSEFTHTSLMLQDCSQPSSESAGEVWAASQAAACNQQQDLAQMGTECAAAVNLLSMTRPQGSLQQYASTAPQHQTLPTHAQVNAACLPNLSCWWTNQTWACEWGFYAVILHPVALSV